MRCDLSGVNDTWRSVKLQTSNDGHKTKYLREKRLFNAVIAMLAEICYQLYFAPFPSCLLIRLAMLICVAAIICLRSLSTVAQSYTSSAKHLMIKQKKRPTK
jgi:hypothetical protein